MLDMLNQYLIVHNIETLLYSSHIHEVSLVLGVSHNVRESLMDMATIVYVGLLLYVH